MLLDNNIIDKTKINPTYIQVYNKPSWVLCTKHFESQLSIHWSNSIIFLIPKHNSSHLHVFINFFIIIGDKDVINNPIYWKKNTYKYKLSLSLLFVDNSGPNPE